MANFQDGNSPMPVSPLRHVTSNFVLVKDSDVRAGGRRGGSRSPSSIPSSPTSVHSSSSAIFERDIEPMTCPSPHNQNPHRTPRSKTTEQLDQSVPSVLDSAATILASSTYFLEDERISIVAPAPLGNRTSGVTSPISSYGSRSPSPTMGHVGKRTSLLLSTPSPPVQNNVPLATALPQTNSPPGTARANLSIQTSVTLSNVSTPSIVTPTSAYYSAAESDISSRSTTTLGHPPTPFPLPITLPSHPPSPIVSSNTDKRLSFMSYFDLLASTPASLHPLSSLTTSASTSEPPPHIPGVSGLTQVHQHTLIIPNHYYTPSHSPGRGNTMIGAAGVVDRRFGERDSLGGGVFDDLGGEWEREGMGGGLEERLEALLGVRANANAILTPVH